jgi:hypothetical protein
VLRVLLHNGESGSQQGGSTLSQQYIKNDTLDTATTAAERIAATAPTYARKLSEARLAVAVDQALGKDEPLTRYQGGPLPVYGESQRERGQTRPAGSRLGHASPTVIPR